MENLVELKKEELLDANGGALLFPNFWDEIIDFAEGFADAFGGGYRDARESNPF